MNALSTFVIRRDDQGRELVVLRDPDPSSHTILVSIDEKLQTARKLLGADGEQPLSDVWKLLNHACVAIGQALNEHPDLDDEERREAIKVIRRANRELNAFVARLNPKSDRERTHR